MMMKQLRDISIACILINLLHCLVDCYQEDTFAKHRTIFPKSSKDGKAKSTKVIKSKASKYSKSKGDNTDTVYEDEYDTTTTTTDLNESPVSTSIPTTTVQSITSTDPSHTNDTDTSDSDNTTLSSCTHDAQIITIPTILTGQTLANITPMETSVTVPSMFDDCNYHEYPTRFNFANPRLVWYDINYLPDNDKQSNTTCLCTTLRSMENAFIIAVLSTTNDTDTCEGMTCINESDFTSESVVWRVAEGRKYKVAVSVLPSGPPTGTYDLTVIDIGSDSCPEEVGSSVYLPGDCTDE